MNKPQKPFAKSKRSSLIKKDLNQDYTLPPTQQLTQEKNKKSPFYFELNTNKHPIRSKTILLWIFIQSFVQVGFLVNPEDLLEKTEAEVRERIRKSETKNKIRKMQFFRPTLESVRENSRVLLVVKVSFSEDSPFFINKEKLDDALEDSFDYNHDTYLLQLLNNFPLTMMKDEWRSLIIEKLKRKTSSESKRYMNKITRGSEKNFGVEGGQRNKKQGSSNSKRFKNNNQFDDSCIDIEEDVQNTETLNYRKKIKINSDVHNTNIFPQNAIHPVINITGPGYDSNNSSLFAGQGYKIDSSLFENPKLPKTDSSIDKSSLFAGGSVKGEGAILSNVAKPIVDYNMLNFYSGKEVGPGRVILKNTSMTGSDFNLPHAPNRQEDATALKVLRGEPKCMIELEIKDVLKAEQVISSKDDDIIAAYNARQLQEMPDLFGVDMPKIDNSIPKPEPKEDYSILKTRKPALVLSKKACNRIKQLDKGRLEFMKQNDQNRLYGETESLKIKAVVDTWIKQTNVNVIVKEKVKYEESQEKVTGEIQNLNLFDK